jgi:predicted MFS family arabinose efflux permease
VRGTALAAAGLIALVLLGSALAATGMHAGLPAGALAVLAWGAAFGLVPVAMTTWMLTALPGSPEAGQALLVSFFQVAIATGAFVGGVVVDGAGIASVLLLGGVLAALAALLIAVTGKSVRLS